MNVASAAVECGEIQEWRQVWWKIAAGGQLRDLIRHTQFPQAVPGDAWILETKSA